jgi:hypothetical protein
MIGNRAVASGAVIVDHAGLRREAIGAGDG